jgi:putative oxidoreductase
MFNKLMKCECANTWGDIAPLFLRVALGIIFAWHGYDKVMVKGIPAIGGFLGSIGFPMPEVFAFILGYGELLGGLLLIAGLLTHWVAKFDIIVAVVAFLTVHMSKGFAISDGGYEYIMLIFAAAVSLMITGAGKYSLDAQWLHKPKGGGVM